MRTNGRRGRCFPASSWTGEQLFLTSWPRSVAGAGRRQSRKLGAWLDEAFRLSWARHLAEMTSMPLGAFAESDENSAEFGASASYRLAVQLLVARGLQQQAHANAGVSLQDLATGFALLRQGRHAAALKHADFSLFAELFMLQGLERWLERLDGRPDLLQRAWPC